MPQFHVDNTFLFGGDVRQAGSILTISKDDLGQEIALGKHPTRKERYLSGLLNHCSPADDATSEQISGKALPPQKTAEEMADEIAERTATIYAQMDEMGISYDRRWKLPRLENELIKAKKIRGE